MRGLLNRTGVVDALRRPLPLGYTHILERKGERHGWALSSGVVDSIGRLWWHCSWGRGFANPPARLDEVAARLAWPDFAGAVEERLLEATAGSDELDAALAAAIALMPAMPGRCLPPAGSPSRDPDAARALLAAPWSWTRVGAVDPNGPGRYTAAERPFECAIERPALPDDPPPRQIIHADQGRKNQRNGATEAGTIAATALMSAAFLGLRHVFAHYRDDFPVSWVDFLLHSLRKSAPRPPKTYRLIPGA